MSMPETSVYKYYCVVAWQNQIRLARKAGIMQTVTKPFGK